MIALDILKTNRLKEFNQIILCNDEGLLLQSCDSIFSTTSLAQTPVYLWFPFIESIFQIAKDLKISDAELLFPKIEHPAPFLSGYYDFSFSRIQDNDNSYILWSIYDYTALYKDLIQFQQERNELEISRQIKQYKALEDTSVQNMAFSLSKDILQEKNIIVDTQNITEAFNEVFQYFSHFPVIFKLPSDRGTHILAGDLIYFKQILFNLLKNILPHFKQSEVIIQYYLPKESSVLSQMSISIFEKSDPTLIIKLKKWLEIDYSSPLIPTEYESIITSLYVVKNFLEQKGGQLSIIIPTTTYIKLTIHFPFAIALSESTS